MFTRFVVNPLRDTASRLQLPPIQQIARLRPGVMEVLRLTINYHDQRHPDQVATLIRTQGNPDAVLEVTYQRGGAREFTLMHVINAARVYQLNGEMRKLRFDALLDPTDLPIAGYDTWLLERAAGSLSHELVFAPDWNDAPYSTLAATIRTMLKEAVRSVNK